MSIDMKTRVFSSFIPAVGLAVLLPILAIITPEIMVKDFIVSQTSIAFQRDILVLNEGACNQTTFDFDKEISSMSPYSIYMPVILRSLVCGMEPTPPGGSCPGSCTGGCANGVWTINCLGSAVCMDTFISCPAGFACEVVCSGMNSCRASTINCPTDYSCNVICDGEWACQDTITNCSETGTCDLTCGADTEVCVDAFLYCGSNQCTTSCLGSSFPTTVCGASCSCTTCP